MNALLLTLGHNSSAIFVRNDKIISGFETERFTQKKSDSAFPYEPIIRFMQMFKVYKPLIYVSHWFPNPYQPWPKKYWNNEFIENTFPYYEVMCTMGSPSTHHRFHAESAVWFAGDDFPQDYHVIVCDGFGNYGEHLTVFRNNHGRLVEELKYSGYFGSLGLLYQYTTKCLGLKMHQDEYKLLGFESKVQTLGVDIRILNDISDRLSDVWLNMFGSYMEEDNLDNLPEAEKAVQDFIDFVTNHLKINDLHVSRILISYIVQRILENVITSTISKIGPNNLILAGGVFLNVKLNKLITTRVPGKVCFMPLAGDQGAAIGCYQYFCGNLERPDNLLWGDRRINRNTIVDMPNMVLSDSPEQTIEEIRHHLNEDGIVNLVRGRMEFGPRALCNTSTLAIPTKENAKRINKANQRENTMPFSLVMTKSQAESLMFGTEQVHRSLEYMVCALDVRPYMHKGLEGGMHYYPLFDSWTCRPQITSDPMMVELLNHYGPLINTSFNFHGVPICMDDDHIVYTHDMQQRQFTTVVEV